MIERRSGHHRLTAVVALLLCLVATGFLSSCGEESDTGGVDLGERAENDQPLNPPTLRFHVSADGVVEASPELEAEAGEVTGLVLENDSDEEYELSVRGPDGDLVLAVGAPASTQGEGRAMPRDVGPHTVTIHPTGEPGAAEEFVLEVSET